jgi:hypothetical protein
MELGRPQGKVESGAAVLGWRAWAVTRTSRGVRLASPLFDHFWLPGEPGVASCLRHEDPFAPALDAHAVTTQAECGCGFHAARDPADALSYLHGRDAPATLCRVLGEVTLWGEVLQTEAGWRGTLAYPARLYVPDPLLAEEFAVYGVSVSSAECGSPSSPTCTGTPSLSAPRLPMSSVTTST